MFLHSGKNPDNRSNRKNRHGYCLFRVLTSSYHHVNMPGFQKFFDRFWQCVRRDRQGDFRMNSHPLSKASSISVAGYLTELPPQKVPGQKFKAAVAMQKEPGQTGYQIPDIQHPDRMTGDGIIFLLNSLSLRSIVRSVYQEPGSPSRSHPRQVPI